MELSLFFPILLEGDYHFLNEKESWEEKIKGRCTGDINGLGEQRAKEAFFFHSDRL